MSGEGDLELRLKLLRMQRRLLSEPSQKDKRTPPPEPEDPEKIVRDVLRERGEEVLEAALQQFPAETRQIIKELADLVKVKEVREITGSWLFSLLHQIGLPVRVKTTLQIVSDGKAGSIADKLKES